MTTAEAPAPPPAQAATHPDLETLAPLVQLSTKQRFQQQTGAIKEHNEMLDRPAFWRGSLFALILLSEELAADTRENPEHAAANASAQYGATRFLELFKKMAWQAKPAPQIIDHDNLPKARRQ
jgi:hypothetical protein